MDQTNNKIRRTWIAGTILCFVNTMNYCDRFILTVILTEVKEEFHIKNDMAGLLQTLFYIMFVTTAPIFGYLGDRFSRKIIMAVSVLIWNVATFFSSFTKHYWPFAMVRSILGIGQAGFTTVAPTILGDLFMNKLRSKILAVFYLAIPVGMGFGYAIGKHIQTACGSWRWSLRTTPAIGVLNTLLILFALHEPKRGQLEAKASSYSSFIEDVKYLFNNRSFVFSTLGFTCITFATDAISWWGPLLLHLGFKLLWKEVDIGTNSTIFGAVVMMSGITGLCLAYVFSQKLKLKYPKCDPLICAVGLIISAPFLMGSTYASTYNFILAYACLFLGLVMLNLNWAITVDILMYVVVPSKRSLAMGLQLFLGHGLGGLASPYITGTLSDQLNNKGMSTNPEWNEFKSLQYSCFLICVVEVLGGLFFFANAYYILDDKERWQIAIDKEDQENNNNLEM